MKIVLCHPDLTLRPGAVWEQAMTFYECCKKELNKFISDVQYLTTDHSIRYFLNSYEGDGLVLAFFDPPGGQVDEAVARLLERCRDQRAVIWPVAMSKECRMPPESVQDCQSFDVSAQLENRQLPEDNIPMIAFIFARKLISQALPALLSDKSLYFISHRRADGENLAGRLADKINLLARERRGYRDVVEVQIGSDAQNQIDEALKDSDVLILLQTPEAGKSGYIKKEVLYALLHDIPVLWIQIDGADREGFEFIPLQSPHMSLNSEDFENPQWLERLADEVERRCFYLIMNNSGNVYSYVDLLKELGHAYSFEIINDKRHSLAYYVNYERKRPFHYADAKVKQYIQYFGRNPKKEDRDGIKERADRMGTGKIDSVILLSTRAREQSLEDHVYEDNYEDYLRNLESEVGGEIQRRGKSIVISGAFPDYDEIYQSSLSEAVIAYAKEIIQQGYTLIFGAHPTFQEILLEIGRKYSCSPKESVYMYMAEDFAGEYDLDELGKRATVQVTPRGKDLQDSLFIMRRKMLLESKTSAVICLGGRIKTDKRKQGVDEEIRIAREAGIPVFLSGSVGGRSSELAAELNRKNSWGEINDAGAELNEELLYSVNHRKIARRIIKYLERIDCPSGRN